MAAGELMAYSYRHDSTPDADRKARAEAGEDCLRLRARQFGWQGSVFISFQGQSPPHRESCQSIDLSRSDRVARQPPENVQGQRVSCHRSAVERFWCARARDRRGGPEAIHRRSSPKLSRICARLCARQRSSCCLRFLAGDKKGSTGGDVHWSYTKFIVDRTGKVVARFEPHVAPNSPELELALEDVIAGTFKSPAQKDDGNDKRKPASGRTEDEAR